MVFSSDTQQLHPRTERGGINPILELVLVLGEIISGKLKGLSLEFPSVYSAELSAWSQLSSRSLPPPFGDFKFDEIPRTILFVKPHQFPRSDSVHPTVLNKLAHMVASVPMELIHQSLTLAKVTLERKPAVIFPPLKITKRVFSTY